MHATHTRQVYYSGMFLLALAWALPACGTAPKHPEPKPAVKRCNAALQISEEVSVVERQTKIVQSCLPLFMDEACRASLNGGAANVRQSELYRGCLAGYCGVLTDTPSLCKTGADKLDPLTETVQKEEFFEKALFHDLGRDAFGLLDRRWVVLLSSTTAVMEVSGPQSIVALPPTDRDEQSLHGVSLYLTMDGEKVYIQLNDPTGSRWAIPMGLESADEKGLLKAMRALSSMKKVNVIADDSVPWAAVTWVMDRIVTIEKDAQITFVKMK